MLALLSMQKTNRGSIPFDLIPDDSSFKGADVYWLLNDATFRGLSVALTNKAYSYNTKPT